MLDIINVTKRFYSLVALNKVSLQVKQGEVLGVLGPNGAGKTTLFRLIAGLLFPDFGDIKPTNGVWPSLGYKAERLLFPNHLNVSQYLTMMAEVSGQPPGTIKDSVQRSLESVKLQEAADKKIKDCSKGMRQRLGLAQAMMGDPQLLLLDEPTNGLDPEGQTDICHQIKALQSGGKTIVLASHQLAEVTRVCTHLVILNKGKIHYRNSIEAALSEKPHITIFVDGDLSKLQQLLISLHPQIEVKERQVILNLEAIEYRPKVLRLLLSSGYDILDIEQSRVTLEEIYSEAVQ